MISNSGIPFHVHVSMCSFFFKKKSSLLYLLYNEEKQHIQGKIEINLFFLKGSSQGWQQSPACAAKRFYMIKPCTASCVNC